MPFTTPATAVAGTILTAAFLNTNLRDDTAWIATDSPCCRVYNSANISITVSGTPEALTFNSERFDNAAMHDTSSVTGRITVPTGGGGKYIVGANTEFTTNATGYRGVYIRLNGAVPYIAIDQRAVTAATASEVPAPVTVHALAAADYVESMAVQSSGGALNVLATGNYSPEFWALWFRT